MGDRENHPTECLFHLLPVLKSLAGGGITRYSGRIRSSLNVDVSESNNQFHLVVLFLSFSNFIVNIVNILKKSKDTASTIDRSFINVDKDKYETCEDVRCGTIPLCTRQEYNIENRYYPVHVDC